MKVDGVHYRTIWLKQDDETTVQVIDERWLPHRFVVEDLKTVEQVATAIKEMHVRGAPSIGATAAFGMYLAALEAPKAAYDQFLNAAAITLVATRPTAIDLSWAVRQQLEAMQTAASSEEKVQIALRNAKRIANETVENCRLIGEYGVDIIEELGRKKNGGIVNILTHCNAGWLACVDYGTATAPIYAAFERGIKIHVWVDETRPRSQGARLTAWELLKHGVPHTVIVDNVGGHLMQHQMVDMCIVGADRVTRTGDVANQIGTYLKALAAHDNNVPFYVALPSSTFDWTLRDGLKEIPIEQRSWDWVNMIQGLHEGEIKKVLVPPKDSPVTDYAFDVTPARFVTRLITERGICPASEEGILGLYPEHR
jgi:methylthioribose-1-phosphate isomerase